MQVKCDYCGSLVDEEASVCPNCGAALSGVNRFAGKQPKTIEELKEWYVNRHLPPEEVTRFFIGKDVREPRAFGIYQDETGDFVVYKNKSDGQRAVRYQGSDEAYAVNELYQRLRIEIADRKNQNRNGNVRSHTNGSNTYGNGNASLEYQKIRKRGNEALRLVSILGTIWMVLVILIIICMCVSVFHSEPTDGYYRYNQNIYYFQDDSWYYYNDLQDDWSHVDSSQVPEIDFSTQSEYATDEHEGMQFEDSTWYVEEPIRSYDSYDDYDDDWDDDWDNDWDSDYDWDSGDSWDSGGTDWDSDW